jgi:hypothetical protein
MLRIRVTDLLRPAPPRLMRSKSVLVSMAKELPMSSYVILRGTSGTPLVSARFKLPFQFSWQ